MRDTQDDLERDCAATREAAAALGDARLRRAVGALQKLRAMILSDLNEQMTPLNQAHAEVFKQPHEAARTIRWAKRVRLRLITDAPALINAALREIGGGA